MRVDLVDGQLAEVGPDVALDGQEINWLYADSVIRTAQAESG
jgi:hypothetical protein